MRTRHPAPRSLAADERGIALAIAMLALVVIGGLVSASFYVGRSEMTVGRNTVYSTQAAEVAQSGLTDVFSDWNTAWNSLAVGASSGYAPEVPPDASGVQWTESVTRLGGNLFLVTSYGERLGPTGVVLASRQLGQLARLTPLDIIIKAAVTSKTGASTGGNGTVDGFDHNPTGWACGALGPAKAGIASNGAITEGGASDIYGSPPKDPNDPAVVDSLFSKPYDAFYAAKSFTFTPGGSDQPVPTTTGSPAACNRADHNNWGEPLRSGGYVPQCTGYYPIVYVNGNLHITSGSGRGQGVLVINGDLDVTGQFEFYGILIAKGEIRSTGGGATGLHVIGAAFAQNATLGDVTLFSGHSVAEYSSCAVATVLTSTATGVPLASRSWIQRWQ